MSRSTEGHTVNVVLYDLSLLIHVYTVTQSQQRKYLAVWWMWWNCVTGSLKIWERDSLTELGSPVCSRGHTY